MPNQLGTYPLICIADKPRLTCDVLVNGVKETIAIGIYHPNKNRVNFEDDIPVNINENTISNYITKDYLGDILTNNVKFTGVKKTDTYEINLKTKTNDVNVILTREIYPEGRWTKFNIYYTINNGTKWNILAGDLTSKRDSETEQEYWDRVEYSIQMELNISAILAVTTDNFQYISFAVIQFEREKPLQALKVYCNFYKKSLTNFKFSNEENKPLGPNSSTGGGNGNFDDSSDPVDFPSLPSFGAVNTGFITMYNISLTETVSLSNWLWSKDFLENLPKLFQNPIESVISMHSVPVTNLLTTPSNLILGTIDSKISTKKVLNQYTELNMGTLNVNEYWGGFLDYAPNTKIQIYMPYVGVRSLNTDEVMGSRLELQYQIDSLNGCGVALLKVSRDNLNSVLYRFPCDLMTKYPVTGRDMTELYKSIAGIALTSASTVALGGLGSVGVGASTLISAGTSASQSALHLKDNVRQNGSSSSCYGQLDVKTPYLIIERPVQSRPSNYSYYEGYTSNVEVTLSEMIGYVEVEKIYPTSVFCNETEMNEIENLLRKGVLI